MRTVKNSALSLATQTNTAEDKARQHNEDLILELEEYYNRTHEKWTEIAKRIDVHPSALSEWRKKRYLGLVDKVNDAVEKFLKIERQKLHSNTKVNLDYVQIANTNRILNLLNTVHTDAIIGVIIGDTGTSKTQTLRKYIAENDVIYLHANRTYRWPVEYFRRIHTHPKVGKDGRGTLNQLANDIINELAGKNVMIIVDQADYLNRAAIDIFRSINEEAGVGICFCGLPSFLSRLRGNEPEVRQLRDRIRVKLELKPYSLDDCQNILQQNFPGLNGLTKTFYDLSNGSIRILSGLVYNTKRIMESPKYRGIKVDESVIKDAAKMLERRIIQ